MPSNIEMVESGQRSPLILTSSKPGQPLSHLSASRFGSSLLIAAASKTGLENVHLWALPPDEDIVAQPTTTGAIRPSQTLSLQGQILFIQAFPDGKVLTTNSNGTSTFFQARYAETRSGVTMSKISSYQPFEDNPAQSTTFNCSSPASSFSSNEVAYAMIDSQISGRVSVFGLLSHQQSNLEVIQDFYYPPIIGNLATSCTVRCSSTAGSPLLVIGDLTGRLHFFDLRLSSVGVPIFTKAGSVKPITCIALHPFSSETVLFGCEDGAISMIDLRLVSGETSSSAAGQTGFAAHTLSVNALAYNMTEPDHVFSAGSDGLLLEWTWTNNQQPVPNDVPSAEPVFTLPGVPFNCLAMDTSRNTGGQTVIAASDFGDVFVIS